MPAILTEGGPFGILQFLVTILLAVIVVRNFILFFSRNEVDNDTLYRALQNMLMMGFLCLITGLLGTFMGVYNASGAISKAAAINTSVVWGGIHVALSTTVWGIMVLFIDFIFWFILRLKIK